MDDLGLTFFLALLTMTVPVVIAFRLALTVFDYFGVRAR